MRTRVTESKKKVKSEKRRVRIGRVMVWMENKDED